MKNNESKLQQSCVKWFRLQYPKLSRLLFSVPNGSKRDKITASILNAEGVVSGVSDLILLIPQKGYSSLCIEMKYGKNKQSDNQKKWQAEVESVGNKYVVCNSIESFILEINSYLR